MNKKWQARFAVARIASYQSNARRSRCVGAALFSNSTLLAIGWNTYGQTHPDAKGKAWNLHAEHRALIKRQYHPLRGNLIIYVYRELANGAPACSRPCANCQLLLHEAGVRIVRFIDEIGAAKEIYLG